MPGAKWRYCEFYWNGDTNGDYADFAYTEDTLINGKTYQIIRLTGTKNQGTITGYNNLSLYTRYSNDSVYRFVYNKDYLFFTWNVALGDVQTSFRSNYDSWVDSACTAKLPLKIVNDYTVNYSGQNLRVILLKDTLYYSIYGGGSATGPDVDYRLVERIGVIDERFFASIKASGPKEVCYLPFIEHGLISLSKYSDDTYEHVFFDCKPSSIDDLSLNSQLKIYPIPSNGELNIEFEEKINNYTIQIYSAIGELVFEETGNNDGLKKLLLSNLKFGLYSILITAKNYTKTKHFLYTNY